MQTEPPKADPPKRKRRWFQFSLRTLFVIVTILAVDCSVCLPILRDWQAQERQRELDDAFRSFKEHTGGYPSPGQQ
jgi:hypothetical protein